jgi:hypothetical protein
VNAPIRISLLKIHNNAVIVIKEATTFSSKDIRPSEEYSDLTDSLSIPRLLTDRKYRNLRSNQVAKMRTVEIGKATSIQEVKEILGASGNEDSKILTNTMLGTVPIKVAIPPIEEA